MLRINKRGSLDDLVYIIGVSLFFALLVLIFATWSTEFNSQIQGSDIIPADGKTAVNQIDELYGGVIDNSFLFLTVGLAIVALIMATLVIIHPIFFIFYVIFLAVVVYVSGVVSNIYQTAAANPALADTAAKLIFISHTMEYLPFIIGVLGFILSIVMYNSWKNR